MANDLNTLRDLRAKLLEAEITAKKTETRYGELKIEEAERNLAEIASTPSEEHILTFAAPMTAENCNHAIRTLDMWSRKDPGCDMTLILNSPGGEVLHGFALHDFIIGLREKGHKVTIKVVGSAMSMAVAILQAGSERIITPNSWLLVHEVSFDPGALNMSKHKESMSITQKLQDKILNILSEKSGMSHAEIESKWENKEWMLSSEEALELKFVDKVEY